MLFAISVIVIIAAAIALMPRFWPKLKRWIDENRRSGL
jgi:hypothetical protein